MDKDEHDGVATALRRNKGPSGAVIRTVSAGDAESAFNDDAGGRGPMPGDSKVGGPGGKGSTAGIRTGSKEAGGGLDVRAAENLRIRQQRRAAAGNPGPAATVVPQTRTPVQTPSQPALEPWEIPAQPVQEAPPAAVVARRPFVPAESGDALERARIRALHTLAALPVGTELFVGGEGLGPDGVEFVMGLGLLVGKGLAVYRGDSHYRLSAEGRMAATEEGYGA